MKLVEYRSFEEEYRATDRIKATLDRKDSTFHSYVCLGYQPHSSADLKQLKAFDFNFDEKNKIWGKCFSISGKVYARLDQVKVDLVEYKTTNNFGRLDEKILFTPLTLAFDAVFYS